MERLTRAGRRWSRRTKAGSKTKECSYCGRRKSRDKFVGRMCSSCKSGYDKKRYLEKKDEIDSRMRAYGKTERGYEVNREASRQYAAGGRANRVHAAWYSRVKDDPEAYAEFLKQHRARNAVHHALKTGKLVKGKCGVCGAEKVEAHHDDYDKPMEVRWVCSLHHGATRRQEAT